MVLLVGLVLLMNASSPHVTLHANFGVGEVDPNENICYIIHIAPVGPGNITIGESAADFDRPGRNSSNAMPPGMSNQSHGVPVQVKVLNPENQIIVEEDVITPSSHPVIFNTRGQYTVYITNNGNESKPVSVGYRFEGTFENKEADKYALAITLTAVGAVAICAGVILQLTQKLPSKQLSVKRE